jgi:hypothetical protein
VGVFMFGGLIKIHVFSYVVGVMENNLGNRFLFV